jgi:HAD superfamily hydrolase (TIGR01458 family)
MLKGVLLDLGGVVYVGDETLPGAVESVERLKSEGLAVRFITNVTRQSRRGLLETLARMGLYVAPDELFMPAIAARKYLEDHDLTPHLLVHPALEEDFRNLPQGKSEAVVIGDAGDGFTYESLNGAFRVLAGGAPFIALARNRSFRDVDDQLSLDAGAFVAALEYASGRAAVILGKPSRDFFHAAIGSLGCAAHEAVMVGDDAEFDVAAAIEAGVSGILVRTGKYEDGVEHGVTPAPTVVVNDLPAAVDWILEKRAGQI